MRSTAGRLAPSYPPPQEVTLPALAQASYPVKRDEEGRSIEEALITAECTCI